MHFKITSESVCLNKHFFFSEFMVSFFVFEFKRSLKRNFSIGMFVVCLILRATNKSFNVKILYITKFMVWFLGGFFLFFFGLLFYFIASFINLLYFRQTFFTLFSNCYNILSLRYFTYQNEFLHILLHQMSLYISIPGKEEFGEVCLLLFTVIASCL